MYSDALENLLSFPANRRKNCWAIIHDRPYTFARYNTDLFIMHCNSTSLIARKNPTSASIFPTLKPIYSQHFLIIIRFMRSAHHLPNHSTISCPKCWSTYHYQNILTYSSNLMKHYTFRFWVISIINTATFTQQHTTTPRSPHSTRIIASKDHRISAPDKTVSQSLISRDLSTT